MKLLYLHGTPVNFIQANNVQVFHMCQAFSDLGIEVTLAIPSPTDEGKNSFDYISQQIGRNPGFQIRTYKRFTFAGRFQMLGNYFGAKSLLRDIKTDLCFVRDPLLLKSSFETHYPILFEVHNAKFHDRNKFLNQRWEKYVIKISKNYQLRKIITISGSLLEFWRNQGIPASKLFVAHDGFSSHLFKERKEKIETRIMLGLPEHQKIVVYVGSLYENRGIERIISLAKRFPKTLFIAIGGLQEQRQYYFDLSIMEDVKNILWKGFLPHSDIPNYLQAADVLLMLFTWDVPTIKFCSPLKVFEYMAAGRPIVGEAYPTITEVLKHNLTAYLANPEDFEDLYENLKIALSDSGRSEMGRLAREKAFELYTWENRARRIMNSVEGLL